MTDLTAEDSRVRAGPVEAGAALPPAVLGLVGAAAGFALWWTGDQRDALDAAQRAALVAFLLVAPVVLAVVARADRPILGALVSLGSGALVAAIVHWRLAPEEASPPFPVVQTLMLMGAAVVLSVPVLGRRLGAPGFDSPAGYPVDLCRIAVAGLVASLAGGLVLAIAYLVGSLFALIGLTALQDLLGRAWFLSALSGGLVGFAAGVARANPKLVAGVQSFLFVLFAWLAPLLGATAVVFLGSLAFTGLTPVWDTRHATHILLAMAGVAFCVVPAAYERAGAGRVSRVALPLARAFALAAAVFVSLSAYSLALRVGQHGWTPDRAHAAFIVACFGLFAAAYALAAAWPGHRPSDALARTSAVAAVLVAVLGLALPTFLDPATGSAADQESRLRDGRAKPESAAVLRRRETGVAGKAALARLEAGPGVVDMAAVDRAVLDRDKSVPPPPGDGFVDQPDRFLTLRPNGPAPSAAVLRAAHHMASGTTPFACPATEGGEPACVLAGVPLRDDGSRVFLILFDPASTAWVRFGLIAESTSGVREMPLSHRDRPTLARLRAAALEGRLTAVPSTWRALAVDGEIVLDPKF